MVLLFLWLAVVVLADVVVFLEAVLWPTVEQSPADFIDFFAVAVLFVALLTPPFNVPLPVLLRLPGMVSINSNALSYARPVGSDLKILSFIAVWFYSIPCKTYATVSR